MGEFLTGRTFSRDRLYRKLGQFVEEAREDGRRVELDFTDEHGFMARRDQKRDRWTYEITDEDRFARFAHRLTEYDALTSEDIEWLLWAARLAKDAAYEKGEYHLAPRPESEKQAYHPDPDIWAAVSQALAKADWPDSEPEEGENP